MAMYCVLHLILVATCVMYSEVKAGGTCLRLENKILDNLLDMIVAIKSGSPNSGGNSYRPAFTATLSTSPVTVSGQFIPKFDNVILNRGNGYDPKTGKFTAPKSGLYHFSFTIMSNGGSDLHMGVAKNGKYLISLYATKTHGDTGTANPVLELKEGDTVYLIHGASATQSMAGYHFSNMSGYYIGE
ncbi:heavy metal-binding protein HIP-like [Mytilus galloprovincialis]|uniref:heavy metal-binding protein HIP-like n=1 Tax=Mytilus galloprovincialis TaxID=29158 RepID=UPI003F7C4058